MQTTPRHIPYLDGWRGLAIAAVLFAHFHHTRQNWWIGIFGVQLFFALSGYLMCRILFVRQAALPTFFARRFIRIAPTFVLFVLSATVYTACFQRPRYVPSIYELISTLTFLRTYYPPWKSIFDADYPVGHLWSLNVEEHSYVFLAMIACASRRLGKAWLTAALLGASTLVALLVSHDYFFHRHAWATPSDVRTEAAALGILASATVCFLRHWQPRLFDRMPAWIPLALAPLAWLCFSTYRDIGLHLTLAPLCLAFTVNYLDRAPALLHALLSTRALRWLGTCSFSLYLWQQPFHLAWLNYGVDPSTAFCLAVGLGVASFYCFEQPTRRLLAAAWRRHSQRIGRNDAASAALNQPG
ncbi:acyltransferase [Massilia forsythiae]|uniref:Acyltransferase n=1 Tax=Massilia forsythiae TaxID=2728020 RepID=A0A7Z2VX63_9BURK|nr:acyltransferase [Massilia forsythiae]QJE01096.1 acyltransferase [Massilia forsythiae]